MVSSRPHAQLEEEDPADEGVEDEARRPRRREMSTSMAYDR
jgi:hypothetical protein